MCNDSRIERKGENQEYLIYGSQTEAALLILAAKTGVYREDIKFSRIEEIPFSSESKMMSVVIDEKDSKNIYSKGAPEVILKKCKYIMINGKKILLTKKESEKIIKQVKEFSSNSYRTIALAYKDEKSKSLKNIEHDLILLGIIGMEDPPRPEVKEAISVCQTAGIKVKMITGDSRETAESIAREIGLKGEILSGSEMDLMSDEELSKIVGKIAIFVRVRPEHKLRIVHALKTNGEIVTMTGDGVNDAPALKESHIGVAMGQNGTDVSREASDLILKDDHFSTIVDAIKEGRTLFNNIQKFAVYQISINIAQVMLILLSVLLGLPLPLVAIQILFMNILSDEITAITLAFNTPSKDVMSKPPRLKSEIITKPLIVFMLIAGILMSIGAVGLFYVITNIMNMPLPVARTAALVVMTLFAIMNAYNFRSLRKLTLTRSLFVNKYLFYASIISILATILAIYTPINKIFELTPIGLNIWIIAVLIALLFAIIIDLIKAFNNKYSFVDKIAAYNYKHKS
jgi:Ca2+-transporting ATPase